MKNTIKVFAFVLLAVLVFTPAAYSQTTTPRTYLTVAIADTSTQTFTVNSTSGMTAATGANNGRFILIDSEVMRLSAIPASGTVTVVRAVSGIASSHIIGSVVVWGPTGNWNPTTGTSTGVLLAQTAANPTGTCVAANNEYLPLYRVSSLGTEAFTCATVGTTTGATAAQWNRTLITPRFSVGSPNVRLTAADTTALITDDIIEVTSLGTSVNRIITLPCSTVPAGKTWRIFDGTGTAGSSGAGITFAGLPTTNAISTGYAGLTFTSDGTNCFRID